jgi:hypothetical protein
MENHGGLPKSQAAIPASAPGRGIQEAGKKKVTGVKPDHG